MKKHIIIAGVPRSGKSTISQRISGTLGYQHISMDSIIAGIERVFPETGINSDADTDLWENIQYISSKMASFIQAMIDSGEYNECDYGMVIDIFQLLPQHYIQYIDSSVCDIYYLGTSDVSPEERYELFKKPLYSETDLFRRHVIHVAGQLQNRVGFALRFAKHGPQAIGGGEVLLAHAVSDSLYPHHRYRAERRDKVL